MTEAAAGRGPWLSIVVPTFNDGDRIGRALASIAAQGDDAVEVVVVDDGSTDGTAAMIERMAPSFPLALTVLSQPTRGPGAARNAGIRRAAAARLLFLDADDALLPGALAQFRRRLDAQPVDFLFGALLQVEGERRRLIAQPPLLGDRARDFAAYVERRRPPIGPGTAVFARRVFDRLQWPEDLWVAEDRVLHAQTLALFDSACFSEAVVEYAADDAKATRRGLERWQDLVQSVDRIFDPALLPAEMMALRPAYEGLTHLTLFRLFQRAGQGGRALRHYRRALSLVPRRALETHYLARAASAAWSALRP